MNLKTFFIHLKMFFVGNKKYVEQGWCMIPCIKCNRMFKSLPYYKRYGVYSIDTKCEECKK